LPDQRPRNTSFGCTISPASAAAATVNALSPRLANTAAASALAGDYLARRDASTLLIVGAGHAELGAGRDHRPGDVGEVADFGGGEAGVGFIVHRGPACVRLRSA
jgi:hypothetical protein